MNINEYKFVVVKPKYGNVYDYCYKDLENLENVDLLNDYIEFKSDLEKKIYYKHFTKKYNLPFRSFWNHRYYRTKFKKSDNVIFITYNTGLDINKYGSVKYLKKKYKRCTVIIFFSDLINKTFNNNRICDFIREYDFAFSFDYNDCYKYNLYNSPLVYSAPKVLENVEEDIDVYFCGKAKDRLDLIMDAFKYLTNKGFNCLFILNDVPNKKREQHEGLIYIDKFMSYEENLGYLKRSKCLLEIMQEGGTGYTLRTCEAIAYNKKIISNNIYLKSAEFYDVNNMNIFNNVQDINIDFIKREKIEYKDRNYFSPIRLLEKVLRVMKEKEGK